MIWDSLPVIEATMDRVAAPGSSEEPVAPVPFESREEMGERASLTKPSLCPKERRSRVIDEDHERGCGDATKDPFYKVVVKP